MVGVRGTNSKMALECLGNLGPDEESGDKQNQEPAPAGVGFIMIDGQSSELMIIVTKHNFIATDERPDNRLNWLKLQTREWLSKSSPQITRRGRVLLCSEGHALRRSLVPTLIIVP